MPLINLTMVFQQTDTNEELDSGRRAGSIKDKFFSDNSTKSQVNLIV